MKTFRFRLARPLNLVVVATALGVLVPALPPAVTAQPSPVPRKEVWRPDGPVAALAVDGDTLYLGGSFGYLGPASGSAGVVDPVEGGVVSAFPALDGTVLALAGDGAGGWFVGGAFTERSTGRANLIHVGRSGDLDLAWQPVVQGTVRALLVDGASLYVGGDFIRINGEERTGVVRFDFPSGGLAAWNPAPNEEVYALARDETRLYVGGAFTSFGRQSRARIAAVDLATGAVTSFNPGASGSGALVRALALSGTTLYVGGEFTTCGGKPRTRLAALHTGTDTVNALDWNPGAGGDVHALAVVGGTIYAGGEFTTAGGANRARLVALDPGSNLARADFDPGANGVVYALVREGDQLLVGGAFSVLGGVACPGAARIESSAGAVGAWQPRISMLAPGANPTVRALLRDADRVVVAGSFASLGGVRRARLAALELSTGLPTAWDPGAGGDVLALAVSGPSLYAGGRFTNIAGVPRVRLASLDRATGTANPFAAPVTATGNNGVYALLCAGTRLYVAGNFSAVQGQARAHLAEVDARDGTLNATWNPAPNGAVTCLASDGVHLYVGGAFSTLGGSNRPFLGAVAVSGAGKATAMQPRAGDDVRALALSASGDRLYVGGDFSQVGGAPRRRLAALDPATGDAVVTWNPDVSSPSGTFLVQALQVSERMVYAGGVFTTAGGEFRSRLAAIEATGGAASPWDPGANAAVRALAFGSGWLVAGGDFTGIGGLDMSYLAVFSTLPFFPTGAVRIAGDGVPEVTLWEGDVPGETVVLESSSAAGGAVWTEMGSRPLSGRPWVFRDPGAPGQPGRMVRAAVR